MRHSPALRRCAGAIVLAALALALPAAVMAQGGGGGSSGGAGSTAGAGTGRGTAADDGQARSAPGLGGRLSGDREQVRQRLEDAGVAAHPAQRREQLEDLNELSRQLAPGVPVPAPGVEDGGRR